MKMKYRRILKRLRKERDLSQADVARVLQCTQVAYGMYESGKRRLSIENLIKLANYYNTTTDYMLGLSNKRKRTYRQPNEIEEEEYYE